MIGKDGKNFKSKDERKNITGIVYNLLSLLKVKTYTSNLMKKDMQ